MAHKLPSIVVQAHCPSVILMHYATNTQPVHIQCDKYETMKEPYELSQGYI